MKVVHLSDIHLGFRQYQRQTQSGLNQREADVALAFRKAVDQIIELRPDVILIGGDVFHAVRPTNPAILHAYNQFARLREMLPDTDIIMVTGNHETPRMSETGYILRLFLGLGISVVDTDAKRLSFRDGELSIFAVPCGIRPLPVLDRDPSAKYNILLIHDQVEGIIKRFGTDRPTNEVSVEDLSVEQWDYVALGHYHVYHQVAPNAWYSGSLEYTSSNIWGEVDEENARKNRQERGKGFIERHLDSGFHKFHTVSLARRVVDLPAVNAEGLTSAQLSDVICGIVDECDGGIDDKIVRLVVRDCPRHILRDLDHRKIREFKRRAMHFLLDARKPQPVRIEAGGAPGRRASLTETVRAMLEAREVTPGIDRKNLVDLGLHYLTEADRMASALTGEEE